MLADTSYWFTWFPGAVLAALGVIAVSYKGLKFIVRLDEALPTIYKIHAEFSPNSGSSLKDQLNQIESHQTASNVRMDKHIKDDERAFTKIDGQLDRIEDHVKG